MATRSKKGDIGRSLTEEDVRVFERAHSLKMLSNFERSFLDNFAASFRMYGYKANIFPKQEAVLRALRDRLPVESR